MVILTEIPTKNGLDEGATPPSESQEQELEQEVGDFITRLVLEKDVALFEG